LARAALFRVLIVVCRQQESGASEGSGCGFRLEGSEALHKEAKQQKCC
jgi:hypothetical protein